MFMVHTLNLRPIQREGVSVVVVVVPEEDPNAEPCHWLEVEHLWRTVYSTSFTLPPGVTETGDQREVAAKVGFSSLSLSPLRLGVASVTILLRHKILSRTKVGILLHY